MHKNYKANKMEDRHNFYTENGKTILKENKIVLNRGNHMFIDQKTPDYKNIHSSQTDIQIQHNPK